MTDPSEPDAALAGVILYDGVCGLCNTLVAWLVARDAEARFRFAPLQGDYAASMRRRFPEIPSDLDTMVFVENAAGGDRVYLRSAAALRVARYLPSPWRVLSHLELLPRAFTDLVYRRVARSRYRLFGRYETCRLPSPEERERFLA